MIQKIIEKSSQNEAKTLPKSILKFDCIFNRFFAWKIVALGFHFELKIPTKSDPKTRLKIKTKFHAKLNPFWDAKGGQMT